MTNDLRNERQAYFEGFRSYPTPLPRRQHKVNYASMCLYIVTLIASIVIPLLVIHFTTVI